MPATAQFLKWHEMREGVPGQTPYSGYLVVTDSGQKILVASLSHGPRTFPYKGPEAYVLEHEGECFEVPDEFFQQVSTACTADQLFRQQFDQFETSRK